MYFTELVQKEFNGKRKWVCLASNEHKGTKLFSAIAYPTLRVVHLLTEKQVALGSCKKPHHYVNWSK